MLLEVKAVKAWQTLQDQELAIVLLEAMAGYPLVILLVVLIMLAVIAGLIARAILEAAMVLHEAWARTTRFLRPLARLIEI